MQRLEVSGALRPIYGSLGFKRLIIFHHVEIYFDAAVTWRFAFVELGNIGEKMDVVYFGAFRRQTVKIPQNCSVRTRKGEKGKKIQGN